MQRAMARDIAEDIRSSIVTEGLTPGERLPTESSLMSKYGVGRSTVREAIKLLQAENIVEIRHGRGSFVASNTGIPADPLGLRFAEQENLLDELMEVRRMLEPEIAALAAERRLAGDVERMEEMIRRMRECASTGEKYDVYDYGFHTAIAESTHNRVLNRIFPVILEAVEKGYEKTVSVDGSVERALDYHRKILDAIILQDSSLASELVRKHIEQALQT